MPSAVYVSATNVALRDAALRVQLTLDSLSLWTSQYKGLRIVICDGSGYDFSNDIQNELPDANIECLHFYNDAKLVAKNGKGYGEGEIVDYALKHSKYLESAELFAKCTSKHFVSNLDAIMMKWNDNFLCECYFIKYWSLLKLELVFIDTRFYISNKTFYIRYLKDIHYKVRDSDNYYLEHVFKDAVLNNKISKIISPVPINLSGTSGSSGKSSNPYRRAWIGYLKQFIRRFIIRMNPTYRSLLL